MPSNVFQITFNSSHTSANYVIQVTGQGAIANVSSSNVPTAIGVRVVMHSAASTWPTGTHAPFSSLFTIENYVFHKL